MSKSFGEAVIEALTDFIVEAVKWYARREIYSSFFREGGNPGEVEELERKIEDIAVRALMLPRQVKNISMDGNKVIIELEEA